MKNKQTTLKTLRELKAKLYVQADQSIRAANPHDPETIIRIQRKVDRDAAHIAFVINMVGVKM